MENSLINNVRADKSFELILGQNSSNFTAASRLFTENSSIRLWRFEVVYIFTNEQSSSSITFTINQPPSNGSCLISPTNGSITTVFTISCMHWYDEDGIKDYSVYGKAYDTDFISEIDRSSF